MTLRIAITVFLAALIVIAAFAFFTPHANRGGEQAPGASRAAAPPEVSLTDTYKKGLHTLSGSLMAATPCSTLTASANVASGTPEAITLELTLPPDTGLCLQQVTKMPFSVQVAAGEGATIATFVNGQVASTTNNVI